MFKLPHGWVECELKDIGEIVTGSTPSTKHPEYYGDDYPFYKPTDLNYGYFVETAKDTISTKGYEISRKLPAKSVLVTCIGATIGKTGLIRNEGICNQQINAVLPNKHISSEFVYFYAISSKIQNQIKINASATTLPILNKSGFEKLMFLLPPLNEQKRIVEKIEEEFGKIDDGVEKLKLAQEQIKQYRQSVLNQQFKIKHAETLTLNDVTTKINDGTHKTPIYVNVGIPFISVKDIKNKQIYFDNCKFITKEEHEVLYKRCNPEKGDVLITKSGTIGRTAVVDTDIIFDLFVSVALLKPQREKITSEFLMYTLDNYISHIDVKQDVKGGLIKNLHIEDIKKIKINLPTLDEQKQIVKEIEKRFEVADEVERVIAENLEKAEQLKQSILKKAFEGRLVPQDPTDQPASELLAQIQAERNK